MTATLVSTPSSFRLSTNPFAIQKTRLASSELAALVNSAITSEIFCNPALGFLFWNQDNKPRWNLCRSLRARDDKSPLSPLLTEKSAAGAAILKSGVNNAPSLSSASFLAARISLSKGNNTTGISGLPANKCSR